MASHTVHRRILYGDCTILGLTAIGPTKIAARGGWVRCIGKYHPRDTADVRRLVRMAQDFSMRMPLRRSRQLVRFEQRPTGGERYTEFTGCRHFTTQACSKTSN